MGDVFQYFTKENREAISEILRACSGIAPIIYGGITVYIAVQQYKGNQLKLKHDLYERRLKVYKGLTDLLGFIGREADIQEEQLWTFRKETADGCFLFGREIPSYLKVVFQSAVDLRTQNIRFAGERFETEAERTAVTQKNSDLLKWFDHQFEVAEEKFSTYLALR
jgi:hypothetical protein